MTDITEFLTARWDEEEAMASAAIDDDSGQDGGFEDAYQDLIHAPSGVGIAQGGFGEAAARMIVWNTPRRVLADIAAKRALIADLSTFGKVATEKVVCDPATSLTARGIERGIMHALRTLAQPHDAHPDYDPDWRVG